MITNSLGYPGIFLERQRLQRILYDSIQDKAPLCTLKQVVAIEDDEEGAILVAADGTSVTCDFVVGADGVRSAVRQEIEKKSPREANSGGTYRQQHMYLVG